LCRAGACEAQPVAAGLGPEWLEQVLDEVGGDTGAVVLDAELDALVPRPAFDSNVGAAVAVGVGEEIHEDPLQSWLSTEDMEG
jgi:hypothetical protein